MLHESEQMIVRSMKGLAVVSCLSFCSVPTIRIGRIRQVCIHCCRDKTLIFSMSISLGLSAPYRIRNSSSANKKTNSNMNSLHEHKYNDDSVKNPKNLEDIEEKERFGVSGAEAAHANSNSSVSNTGNSSRNGSRRNSLISASGRRRSRQYPSIDVSDEATSSQQHEENNINSVSNKNIQAALQGPSTTNSNSPSNSNETSSATNLVNSTRSSEVLSHSIVNPPSPKATDDRQFELANSTISHEAPHSVYTVFSPSQATQKKLEAIWSTVTSKKSIVHARKERSTSARTSLINTNTARNKASAVPMAAPVKSARTRRSSMPAQGSSKSNFSAFASNIKSSIGKVLDKIGIKESNENLRPTPTTSPVAADYHPKANSNTEKGMRGTSEFRKASFSYLDNIKQMNNSAMKYDKGAVILPADRRKSASQPITTSVKPFSSARRSSDMMQGSIIRPDYSNERDVIIRRNSFSKTASPANLSGRTIHIEERRNSNLGNFYSSSKERDDGLIKDSEGKPVLAVYTPKQNEQRFRYEPDALSY
jgi:hypothetical protein